MYKVFINNKCIVFSDNSDGILMRDARIHKYVSSEELFQNIDTFEKDKQLDKLYVIGDPEKIISQFPFIEAAGGLVKKTTGEILFIYRYGKWDLPKGKCETGEKHEETAIREVTEETGVTELKITKDLTATYHTYKTEGKRVIKKTWWYEMTYTDDSKILPQKIEDISVVKWLSMKDIPWAMRDSYASIIELLTQSDYL